MKPVIKKGNEMKITMIVKFLGGLLNGGDGDV